MLIFLMGWKSRQVLLLIYLRYCDSRSIAVSQYRSIAVSQYRSRRFIIQISLSVTIDSSDTGAQQSMKEAPKSATTFSFVSEPRSDCDDYGRR